MVLNAFADLNAQQVEDALRDLCAAQKIKDNGKAYVAVKPWADIAYAEVGEAQTRGAVALTLLNMPSDSAVKVTMTRQNINKHNLNAGDRIVIGLARTANDPQKLTGRFIDKMEPGRNYYMPGIYNYDADAFTPLNRSLKTAFTLASKPQTADVPRQFLVELPAHFDVRDPVIHIADAQAHDVTTGEAVTGS